MPFLIFKRLSLQHAVPDDDFTARNVAFAQTVLDVRCGCRLDRRPAPDFADERLIIGARKRLGANERAVLVKVLVGLVGIAVARRDGNVFLAGAEQRAVGLLGALGQVENHGVARGRFDGNLLGREPNLIVFVRCERLAVDFKRDGLVVGRVTEDQDVAVGVVFEFEIFL